jgi:transposase InsO family protein
MRRPGAGITREFWTISTDKCWTEFHAVTDARASLGRGIAYYNARRPHSSLDQQTPD